VCWKRRCGSRCDSRCVGGGGVVVGVLEEEEVQYSGRVCALQGFSGRIDVSTGRGSRVGCATGGFIRC
jgi:hypothetical protein